MRAITGFSIENRSYIQNARDRSKFHMRSISLVPPHVVVLSAAHFGCRWNARDPWLLDAYRGPAYYLVPPYIPPHLDLLDSDCIYSGYIRLWKGVLYGLFETTAWSIYSVPPLAVPCQELFLIQPKSIVTQGFTDSVTFSFKIPHCSDDAIGSIVITSKFLRIEWSPL